jgi:hypothetical protein
VVPNGRQVIRRLHGRGCAAPVSCL